MIIGRVVVFFVVFLLLSTCNSQTVEYVDNKQCLSCHQQQSQLWKKSDHYYSMLPATEKTVLGDFNNVIYQNDEQFVKFIKKGKDFFIELKEKNGPKTLYQVRYTFGYHPLQQYLLAFPEGKFQVFNIAWDSVNKKWFNVAPKNYLKTQSPFHWKKRFYNWNHACAECHSTNFQKNYRGKSGYKSTFAGVNVNCQACHGPGSEHIKWVKNRKAKDKGLIVPFSTMKSHETVELCAHCHSRRAQVTAVHDPKIPFHDQYIASLLSPDLYYADGQIKEEVFVYGSFIQSKMYQAGITCMNCHNPHSLKLVLPGNQVCTQCHNTQPKKRYRQLAGKNINYESFEHTHHQKTSQGSQCISCHMPETTYMKIDPRRDHAFKVPNPELTIKLGIPNACNRCHQDKSPQWALDYVKKWFGRIYQNSPVLHSDNNILLNLFYDTKKPDIFRASALLLIRIQRKKHVEATLSALKEPSPLIKRVALTKLSNFNPSETKRYLLPILNDKDKTLGAAAAFILAGQNLKSESFHNALNFYKKMQLTNRDQPEAITNLAQLHLKQGETQKGIEKLTKAIEKDKHFIPAYQLLVQVYAIKKQDKKVISILQQGISNNPKSAALYFSLGLAFAQTRDYQNSKEALEQVLKIEPNYPRAQYNLNLMKAKLSTLKPSN